MSLALFNPAQLAEGDMTDEEENDDSGVEPDMLHILLFHAAFDRMIKDYYPSFTDNVIWTMVEIASDVIKMSPENAEHIRKLAFTRYLRVANHLIRDTNRLRCLTPPDEGKSK
jgi:hypothetical protein